MKAKDDESDRSIECLSPFPTNCTRDSFASVARFFSFAGRIQVGPFHIYKKRRKKESCAKGVNDDDDEKKKKSGCFFFLCLLVAMQKERQDSVTPKNFTHSLIIVDNPKV